MLNFIIWWKWYLSELSVIKYIFLFPLLYISIINWMGDNFENLQCWFSNYLVLSKFSSYCSSVKNTLFPVFKCHYEFIDFFHSILHYNPCATIFNTESQNWEPAQAFPFVILHVLVSLLTPPCFLTEQIIPHSSYIFVVPYMEFANYLKGYTFF